MTSAVSYASSSLVPVYFGVGQAHELDAVEIHWPSGRVQQLHHVSVNRIVDVSEP
jgi:hypothetical protein